MKNFNLKFILALGTIVACQSAFATVITFESLGSGGTNSNSVADGYTESGYQFNNLNHVGDAVAFAVWQTGNTNDFNGSTALFNNYDSGQTEMTQVGGGGFNVTSIDMSCLYLNNPGAFSVSFTGTRADASTVTNTFTLNTPNSVQTFNFSGMSNVVKLDWTQSSPYHQFDNININTVPEPASLAVLGLGAFALIRRRKNS